MQIEVFCLFVCLGYSSISLAFLVIYQFVPQQSFLRPRGARGIQNCLTPRPVPS